MKLVTILNTGTSLFRYIAKPHASWPSVHAFLHGKFADEKTVQSFDGHAGVAGTSESSASVSAGVLHHDIFATGVLKQ